ncbi:MAG TPA: hypothetical protein VGS41_15410, partial [Chthonomonadales bacterium]|nr:hypothetical protein [Chthonomonadales bacterium]
MIRTVLVALGLFSLSFLTLSRQATVKRPVKPPALKPLVSQPVLDNSDPAIQVRLSRPVYYITLDPATGAPEMPRNVAAEAAPVNWPAATRRPESFTWRVTLEWLQPPYPTRHSIGDRTFSQMSPLRPAFGNEVRGGTLTVYAKASLQGRPIFGEAHALVVGENPSRGQALNQFPRDRTGLIASKIGMAESGLRQFVPGDPSLGGGFPVLSRTHDVGMM